MLNASTQNNSFNNFYLSCARLSNKVISDFEAPEQITEDFLCENKVDYIVDTFPFRSFVLSSGRLILIYDGKCGPPNADTAPAWRVWKVMPCSGSGGSVTTRNKEVATGE